MFKVYYTPNLKSACFVCYLKLIKTFVKNNIRILSKLSKDLRNDIKILVGK